MEPTNTQPNTPAVIITEPVTTPVQTVTVETSTSTNIFSYYFNCFKLYFKPSTTVEYFLNLSSKTILFYYFILIVPLTLIQYFSKKELTLEILYPTLFFILYYILGIIISYVLKLLNPGLNKKNTEAVFLSLLFFPVLILILNFYIETSVISKITSETFSKQTSGETVYIVLHLILFLLPLYILFKLVFIILFTIWIISIYTKTLKISSGVSGIKVFFITLVILLIVGTGLQLLPIKTLANKKAESSYVTYCETNETTESSLALTLSKEAPKIDCKLSLYSFDREKIIFSKTGTDKVEIKKVYIINKEQVCEVAQGPAAELEDGKLKISIQNSCNTKNGDTHYLVIITETGHNIRALKYISNVVPKDFVATTPIETTEDLDNSYNKLSGLTQIGVPNVKQNTITLETHMNERAEKTSDFKISIDKMFIFKDNKICDTVVINKTYGLGKIELSFDDTKCGFSLPETHWFRFAVIAETSQKSIIKSDDGSNLHIQKGYLEAFYSRSTTTPPFN